MSAGIGGINVDGAAGAAAGGGITNINISAGTTSNNLSAVTFASSPTVRFGLNASTVTAAPVEMSIWRNFHNSQTTLGLMGNSSVSIQPFLLQWPVAFSNVMFPLLLLGASTNNTSSAFIDLSVSAVFYSRNVSTLSYITSFSNTMTSTYASNSPAAPSAHHAITMTNAAATTLNPGEYYVAFHLSTDNTNTGAGTASTTLGLTARALIAHPASSNNGLRAWGVSTGGNTWIYQAGILSTGATRSSIAFTDYQATSSQFQVALVAFELRNQTLFV